MSDQRQFHTNEELKNDDAEYISKLLSSLRIVKWKSPVPISKPKAHKKSDYANDLLSNYKTPQGNELLPVGAGLNNVSGECRPSKLLKYTEQVLSSIFPPQNWTANGVHYHQQISFHPSTRLETTALQDSIRMLLIQAQARVDGFCPVRENVTLRCFDEMIRLTAIDSPDRGLLLQDIRDEIRMTLTCNKTLLESAVDYGASKFEQTLQSIGNLRDQVQELNEAKKHLQTENQELRIKMKLMERQFQEEGHAVTEFRKNKLANLKRTNDQLIAMLESVGVDKNLYRHLV